MNVRIAGIEYMMDKIPHTEEQNPKLLEVINHIQIP